MAGTEDRAQAAARLKIHKRNLNRLELRKASLGGSVDIATENQIDQEKANIAALEPIANPPPAPSPEIQEFVKQTTPGDIDLTMLFIQGTQVNARVTKIEEKVETVVQAQSAAQLWRLDIADRLQNSDLARIYGQRRNFRISIGQITLILFVLLLVLILFARAGLL